jgi:outer membrane protease
MLATWNLFFNSITCDPIISQIEFAVLTAATMKSYMSWDIMPCSPVKLIDLWKITLPYGTFLWNNGWLSSDCTMLHSRKQNSFYFRVFQTNSLPNLTRVIKSRSMSLAGHNTNGGHKKWRQNFRQKTWGGSGKHSDEPLGPIKDSNILISWVGSDFHGCCSMELLT